ncbi:hypothetical protein [Chryseobacterium hagamense]|uniref:Lipoprotein n=1 Tax=Chryseobacterium hagamense TaxID=395935 RepID=A0A511YPZ8_9FLAO|nr:hypothetical protein [Chryseobacterium hagamense]GEN77271.1 hypothetical protein CHA01nite_30110 [Chryseobacterium hagamense]
MKIRKILSLAFASALLFNIACSDDEFVMETPKTDYTNGIIIANEGGFTTPTSEVSYLTNDLTLLQNGIYGANNNKEILGNVLQTIGFKGDNAYLVMNTPNKIEIVNRQTFKKQATVTANLDNPRYLAFSGNQYYVTNNNFGSVKKINVYNSGDNTFVKSINFDRYAEKVVEAGGNIVVQTDGAYYDSTPPYASHPTGNTVTIINPSSNSVSTTVSLPNTGAIIKDLVSYNGSAYVLTSNSSASYIYKINTATGAYQTTTLTTIPQADKLKIDSDKFYFVASSKVYSMNITAATAPTSALVTLTGVTSLYGFNVIDGRLYIADAKDFTADSKVSVYNANNGSLLTSFNTGIATNGFYKN